MKKQKKIKFKYIMIFIFTILIIALSFCIKDILDVLRNKSLGQVEIIDTIEDYQYTLNENDSQYFKQEFKKLKETLTKKEIDEEVYVELISKLFLIDFFSLDSAINKNDVGGVQFIYIDYQQDFIKGAKDSIYKYVKNNIYKNRTQELPLVKNIEIIDIDQQKVEYETKSDKEGYVIEAKITYEKDLDYPEEITLVFIHNEHKLELAEMK